MLPSVAFGQEVVSGKVSNEKGLFRLTWSGKSNNDSLVVSFIGYAEQRIAVNSQENFSIPMKPATALLENVTITNITALDPGKLLANTAYHTLLLSCTLRSRICYF